MYPAGAVQDRFVGDIGDFGKYGLLRALTGIWDWEREEPLPERERLSLGVVWYVPDEQTIQRTPKGHGQKVDYLFNPLEKDLYQNCDPYLFDCLKDIVCGERNLQSIEGNQILGEEESVSFHNDRIPRDPTQRQKWLGKALDSIGERSVMFLDPDIGLVPPSAKNSTKHALSQEVSGFAGNNRSVIIYQSFARKSLGNQMGDWKERLGSTLTSQREYKVLKFKSRAFIILPAAEHAKLIDERLERMLDGPWKQHFTPYEDGG